MPDSAKPKNDDRRYYHFLQPDYTRKPLELSPSFKEKTLARLEFLYGESCGGKCFLELERILQVYFAHKTDQMLDDHENFDPGNRFTEQDIILITYGDLVKDHRDKPLKTLNGLLNKYVQGVFNTIHILPFFPYSSDRGFAVMDFEEVDQNLGNWQDILELKSNFKLMFDGVFNHASSKSRWFQEFLNQNPDYADFFTVFSTSSQISADHLKLIVRPRTSELLSSFDTLNGKRMVWTTFSPDQIDLNFHNPKVLLKMIEIMLTYVRRGADLLRLDAVTYLWEELGTNCVHLDQTHSIICLFRDILDAVAPEVALITETNVPHQENIRYFGTGTNEAQMVYNFALPPLVLHTFQNKNAGQLMAWASGLEKISDQATYFNFLDSHDGIGVMAVKDILSPAEIELMALKVVENGGYISYKDNGDGSLSPYEMNITWWSAINNEDSDEPMEQQVNRYVASRAIALVLMGVPGIYLHGLLGSKNDAELVIEERQTRSINRKNINRDELISALENRSSTTYQVTRKLTRLIRKRNKEPLFHPNACQKILTLSDTVFIVMRYAEGSNDYLISLINITGQPQQLTVPLSNIKSNAQTWIDLLNRTKFQSKENQLNIQLEPYQIIWLKNKK